MAQANEIRFSGIVTTAEIENFPYYATPAGQVGDPMKGHITFNPNTFWVEEVEIDLPSGSIGWGDSFGFQRITGGYSFDWDYPTGFAPPYIETDAYVSFSFANGSGTFLAWGSAPDAYPERISEKYSGVITSVRTVSDSGTTLGLFALGLVALAMRKQQTTKG
jgi:hypothetical protein